MIGAMCFQRTVGSALWAIDCGIVGAMDDPWPFYVAPVDAIRVFRASNPYSIDDAVSRLHGYRHPKLYIEWLFEHTPRIGDTNYAAELRAVVAYAHKVGIKVVGPIWGSGAFDASAWAWFRANGWFGFDAIGIQAYWTHAVGFTKWNALRYRDYWNKTVDPPLIIVECGEDEVRDGDPAVNDGMIGKPGYLANGVSPEIMRAECVNFSRETAKDGVPALLYEAGCPPDWEKFEVDTIAPITDFPFEWPVRSGVVVLPTPTTVGAKKMLHGFDISSNNHPGGAPIDWKLVGRCSWDFAVIKATEGGHYVNPYFKNDVQGARDAGLEVAFYDFNRPSGGSGQDDAKHFIDVAGPLIQQGTVLAADMEDTDVPAGADLYAYYMDHVNNVLGMVGFREMLYSGDWYLKPHNLENHDDVAQSGLWYASYGVALPPLPTPWTFMAVWQYTDKGVVPGIQGNVDLNFFNGDRAMFRRYGKL